MGASLKSFRDPGYGSIEAEVEQKLGLPSGLLASIRTKGERSNADQVSSAGGRTVYQVIPSTRAAFLKKYGVDAYASPKDAAMVAGLHLRDSLQRNGGNQRAAVAEYHGGTNRKNWGAVTDAYVRRVTGAGGRRKGPSTYDRAAAEVQQGPSLDKVYQAYRSGKMTPQERAAFENAVLNGQMVLRPGWKIDRKPSAPVLPQHLVNAYNSRQMDDDPAARQEIERAVAAGEVRLPPKARLAKPAPRTVGENLALGVRPIIEGAGKLVDFVGLPINAATQALVGGNGQPFTTAATHLADAVGLPKAESPSEQRNAALIEGGTQGLITAGAALPFAGAEGAAGAVARGLSSSPVLDTASSASANYSQESARQAGAGPVGQMAAGLIGGGIPIGSAAAISRIRAPRTLPETVAATPREAVIDEAGNLTPHGQEIATHHGVTPAQVVEAYEAPPSVKAGTANDQVEPAVAREATTGAETAPEADFRPAERVAEAEATQQPPRPADAPEARELPPQPNPPDGNSPDAAARVAAGKEFGVDYTRGQATKSFDVQDAEQRLRNSNGPAGEEMRQFVAKQTEQVKAAVEEFRKAFGDTAATPEQRGEAVQGAIRDLRESGQKGVTELYKQARELGQEVPLNPEGIRAAYERLMVEANVPDKVKSELTQEMARYGLIGKAEVINDARLTKSGKPTGAVTAENGVTSVKLDDGQRIRFYGEPQTLRLDNAEELRKVITGLYPEDGARKLTTILKKAIDDATEEAATKLAAQGEKGAELPEALGKARKAHVEQVHTFKAGDVVQKIADWKKGQEGVTGTLKPEEVMRAALASTSDLKRVKAVLLSKPTEASKAAWRAIQAHGLAELFGKATTRNTNAAGEITDAVSGAKLRSAIEGFPPDKLKVLLEPEQFNTLMKLRRVIEDVTVPIGGTVNHSNSANLIMRVVRDVDNQVTAAFAAAGTALGGPVGAAIGGTVGRTIAPAIKAAKEAKAEAATLEGATAYTPERAAADTGEAKPSKGAKVREAAGQSLRAFIDTYSSPRVLAPILVSAEGAQND